jgi:hypothetical protein
MPAPAIAGAINQLWDTYRPRKFQGTPAEYKAGLERAIANSWLWLHGSGTYVRFAQAGAAPFV